MAGFFLMRSFVIVALSTCSVLKPVVAYAGSTTTYSYDALGRVVKAITAGTVNNEAKMTVEYDPADNRRKYVVTGSASKSVVVPLGGLKVIAVPDN